MECRREQEKDGGQVSNLEKETKTMQATVANLDSHRPLQHQAHHPTPTQLEKAMHPETLSEVPV